MKTSFAMIGVAFYKRNNNKEKFEKSKKSKRQIIDMLQGSFSFTKLNLTRVETALLLQFFCRTGRNGRPEVFYKNKFLKILQSSQENTCAGVSLLTNMQM